MIIFKQYHLSNTFEAIKNIITLSTCAENE